MAIAWVLVGLGILVAVVAVIAGYIRYQAFDTATVGDTAEELIADDEVRDQIGATVVDELYNNVDFEAALEQRLPPDQKGLAGTFAAASRVVVDRTVTRVLERPRVQNLWVESVERTHRRLLQVLDDDLTGVSTEGGYVVLNLRPLVVQVGDQVAIVGDLNQRLPQDAGVIRVMKADQLETAQDLTQLFKQVAAVIWIVPFVLWAIALWLARGRRRPVLRTIGLGLIVIGLLVVVIRKVAGDYIVDDLVKDETVRPAAHNAWDILTSLLADGGWTVFGLGVIAVFAVWLSGPSRSATASRRVLAPLLVRPELAYGAAALFLLLIILWGPTAQTRRASAVLVAAILLGVGVEILRRQTAREFPGAEAVDLGASARGTMARLRGSRGAPAPATDERLDGLERLQRLREQGLLTDEELAAEKARLLG